MADAPSPLLLPTPKKNKEAELPPTSGPPKPGLLPTPKAAAEEPKKSALTSSVLSRSTVEALPKKITGFLDTLEAVLPPQVRASKYEHWTHDFLKGVVDKGGTELLDFASSPAGLALVTAHLFPLTAPIAGVVDLGLAGQAAMQAVPDAVNFWRDRSPDNAASLAMDLFAAKGMKEIGAREIRKMHKAGYEKPGFNRAVIETAQSMKSQDLKMAVLDAAVPKQGDAGLRERAKQKIYSMPYVKNVATLAGAPLPKLVEISSNIVESRNARLTRMKMDTERIVNALEKEVPAAERDVEKMAYVIEGSATPDEVGLGPAARQWVDILRKHRRAMDVLAEDSYGHEIPTIDAERYITHSWDFGASDSDTVSRAARTLLHDPFRKKRTIDTWKAGIDAGMKPKIRDVADLIRHRDQFVATAAANSFMAESLRSMGVILSDAEHKKLGMKGWSRASESPALNRAAYGGQTAEGQMILRDKPVWVHPEFHDAVRAVFEGQDPSTAELAFDTIRSTSKKLRLSFSLFHANALTEQAHAEDILRKPAQGTAGSKPSRGGRLLSDIYVFNPEAWKGIRSGLYDIGNRPNAGPVRKAVGKLGKHFDPPVLRLHPDLLNPWIDASMQFHSAESESALAGRINDMAHGSNAILRGLGKLAQPMTDVMHVWDKSLWEFYHPSMMLNSAETIMADEMQNAMRGGKSMSPQEQMELRRNVASHVNNAFGAVNYQNLLQSPKMIRAMNVILLAPAWTLSNMRILMGAMENEAGYRIASKWAKGAALSWFLTTQASNYASTSYYQMPDREGKKGGHFTWDNPGVPMRGFNGQPISNLSENALNIGTGYNPAVGGPGTERYLKLGRAFREPALWFMDPMNTFGNKLGQAPRAAMELFTGSEPGSGYRQFDPQKLTGVSGMMERLALVMTNAVTPMPLQDAKQKAFHYLFPDEVPRQDQSFTMGGFPTSSGVSISRAVKAYTAAMDDGDQDAADMVMDVVVLNHLSPSSVMRGWRQEVTKRRKARQEPEGIRYDTHGNPEGNPPPGAGR